MKERAEIHVTKKINIINLSVDDCKHKMNGVNIHKAIKLFAGFSVALHAERRHLQFSFYCVTLRRNYSTYNAESYKAHLIKLDSVRSYRNGLEQMPV